MRLTDLVVNVFLLFWQVLIFLTMLVIIGALSYGWFKLLGYILRAMLKTQ